MTQKQRSYQISLLKRLHLSPRYLNLYKEDQIAYRAFLQEHLGVKSSKELKISTLIELVEYFEFKRDEIPTNRASNQQINFIRSLWDHHATNKDVNSLLKYLKRTIKRDFGDVDALEALTPKEASQAIAGIKKLKPTPWVNNSSFKGG